MGGARGRWASRCCLRRWGAQVGRGRFGGSGKVGQEGEQEGEETVEAGGDGGLEAGGFGVGREPGAEVAQGGREPLGGGRGWQARLGLVGLGVHLC